MFEVAKELPDRNALIATLSNANAGALATFEGWVRNHNEGRAVLSLEYECYETLAKKEGEKVIAEAKEKFGVLDAACIHRVGKLSVGEVAVWVGVVAGHRQEAFQACRYIIDEIKKRLPIWKKEFYADGSTDWVNCSHHEQDREAKNSAEHEVGHKAEERSDDGEFELHWTVLKSRSPRELVYADIRTDSERNDDQSTKKFLAGRTVLEWPLASLDVKNLQLDPKLTYLFLCRRGEESRKLVKQLRSLGHKNVFSLADGVESMSMVAKDSIRV